MQHTTVIFDIHYKRKRMKTLKKVPYTVEFVDILPAEMQELVVYVSNEYNTAIHKCLCGCGSQVVMPLAHGDGFFKNKGWNMIEEPNGTISFTPSVGNYQQPCNTHYIMTKNTANFV